MAASKLAPFDARRKADPEYKRGWNAALTGAGKADHEQAQQQRDTALSARRKRDAAAQNTQTDNYSNTILSLSYPANWHLTAYDVHENNAYQDMQGTFFHPADDDQSINIFYGMCGFGYGHTTLDYWYFGKVNSIKGNNGTIISAQRNGDTYRIIGKVGDTVIQQAATADQISDSVTVSSFKCMRVAVFNATYPADRANELGTAVNQMIMSMSLK